MEVAGGGGGIEEEEHERERSTQTVRDVEVFLYLKRSQILVLFLVCFFICLPSCIFLVSISLPLSKQISVNKEIPLRHQFPLHLESRPMSVAPDPSVLMEPDSTFPVRLLNKRPELCSALHFFLFFISPLPLILRFPLPPPYFPSGLALLMSSPLSSPNLQDGAFFFIFATNYFHHCVSLKQVGDVFSKSCRPKCHCWRSQILVQTGLVVDTMAQSGTFFFVIAQLIE